MAIVATSQQSRFHTETLEAAINDVDLKGVTVAVGDNEIISDAHLKLFSGAICGPDCSATKHASEGSLCGAVLSAMLPKLPCSAHTS